MTESAYVVRTGYLRRSVTFDGSDVDPDGPDIDPEWDPIGAYRQHTARLQNATGVRAGFVAFTDFTPAADTALNVHVRATAHP